VTSVRNRIGLLLAASVLLAVSACTEANNGSPTPTPSESGPPTTGSSGTPTVPVPDRPKDLPVNGLEACSLLTEGQRQELTVSRTRDTVNGSEHYNGASECVLEVNKAGTSYSYRLLLATNEDVSEWLTGTRNVEATLVSVVGYPAVRYYLRGSTDEQSSGCSTSVGVASGQEVVASHREGTDALFTRDEMCAMSQRVAELAVTTLQGLK